MDRSFSQLLERFRKVSTSEGDPESKYLNRLESNLINYYGKKGKLGPCPSKNIAYTNNLENNLLRRYLSLDASRQKKSAPIKKRKISVILINENNNNNCYNTNTKLKIDERLRKPHTEEVKEVQTILAQYSKRMSPEFLAKTIVKKFDLSWDVTLKDFITLSDRTWLNDVIINSYFLLLQQRDTLNNAYTKRYYMFNTFLYAKLYADNHTYDYSCVNKWTKKLNIFELAKVFIPVNLNNSHWVLIVVHIPEKKISYYDSGVSNTYFLQCTNNILMWIKDEAKKNNIIDFVDGMWRKVCEDVPQQANCYDCGVFTIMFADFICDDVPLTLVKQKDMVNYRIKIGAAILRGKLPYYYCCCEPEEVEILENEDDISIMTVEE